MTDISTIELIKKSARFEYESCAAMYVIFFCVCACVCLHSVKIPSRET